MRVVYVVRWRPFRTFFSVWFLVVVLSMLFGGGKAHAAEADPTQTTTPQAAQADPIWAELGYTTVGQEVTGPWLDRTYWNTTHDYTTPGIIRPAITGRQQAIAGFTHVLDDGTTRISIMNIDQTTHKITGWQPGVDDPAAGTCPVPGQQPCSGPGAGRVVGSDLQVNPLLWLAGKAADGAVSLLSTAGQWAVVSNQPDLTLDWFLDTYSQSFTIAVFCLAFILLYQMATAARHHRDGYEWLTSTGVWVTAFFVGALLGPVVGQALITGTGLLAAGIVSAWKGTTLSDAITALSAQVTAEAAGGGLGGDLMAVVLCVLMLFAAVGLFVNFAIQKGILYLSSAVFALGWVWVTARKSRAGAAKIPLMFAAVCAAKPVTMLLLGVCIHLVKDGIGSTTADPGTNLSNLIAGIFVLLLVSFAPLLLLKFAPVTPAGTAGSVVHSRRAGQMVDRTSGNDEW